MRRGPQFGEELNDGRRVWLDGELVENVAAHPAFAPTVGRLGQILEMHHEEEHRELLVDHLDDGRPYSACYRLPENVEDVQRLGRVSALISRRGLGMMGRLWDPSAGYVMGMYNMRDDVGKVRPDTKPVVEKLFERCRADSLLCNVAFVDPMQAGFVPMSERDTLRVTKTTPEGIVVSGAKTLCTGAAYSNELIVITSGPALRGRADDQIVGFAVKPNHPGLDILCRRSSVDGGTEGGWLERVRSLDEIDCCLVFDDALIPHDRVLYSGEGQVANQLWDAVVAWDKHSFLRRIVTKFEALYGLGFLMAEALGVIAVPPARKAVQNIGYHHALLDQLVSGAELDPSPAPGSGGALVPDQAGLLGALRYAIEKYPEALRGLELLGGQGLVLVPTEKDLASDKLGPIYERYLKGPTMDATSRARLLTLASQLVGSRLSTRQKLLDYYAVGGLSVLEAQLGPLLDASPGIEMVKEFLSDA